MSNFIFLIITVSIILSAIMIIASKNPIHSILFLVLVFVGVTGLLLMLGVEFIAMLFLVVYVGAISVLFLFVVMMLNVKIVELNERFISYLPIGGFIGLIFLSEVLYIINDNLSPDNLSVMENYESDSINYMNYFNVLSLTNIEQIGNFLYTKYVYLFIIASLILLVAMIGAIVLTLNQKLVNKRQDYYTQTNRLLSESIRYLK